MNKTGFRHYDVDQTDFPLVITASTDAAVLPDLAKVTFRLQDVSTGAVTTKTLSWKPTGATSSTLTLQAPASPCNVVFAVQVRFPASNPADKPLKLTFLSADAQTELDEIQTETLPIVFGNYVAQYRINPK